MGVSVLASGGIGGRAKDGSSCFRKPPFRWQRFL